MIESAENSPMTARELREFIGAVLQESSEVANVWSEIGTELRTLYTAEVLLRSATWHAYAQSGLKVDVEPLPATVEAGIMLVLTNLIDRKLKPVLRIWLTTVTQGVFNRLRVSVFELATSW